MKRKQLPWLRLNVTTWNLWREQHPNVAIDLFRLDVFRLGLFKALQLRAGLAIQSEFGFCRGDYVQENLSGANLSRADLSGADLRRANLSGANLSEADLDRADLYLANFTEANLSGANLRQAYLYDANFTEAHLVGVHLSEAHLDRADLSRADLSGADLGEADLRQANLSGANLSEADLDRADLGGADLRRANLSGADFSRADFSRADLGGARTRKTIFDDLDLRTVKGLETIGHEGPSIIATSTLERSEGNIPDIFLRRAGLSETFITYVRSLTQHSIQYYTCFISYSSKDQSFAERLYADLQDKGIHCWYAPEDLKIGDHYHQRIDESILIYDKLILILSEHAIQSTWVKREVVAAREKEDHLGHKVLFPIRLDDAVMQTTKAWAADVRRQWHIGDFTQWKGHDAYQQAFERLLRDLKAGEKP